MTLKPGFTIFIPVFNEDKLITTNAGRLIEFLAPVEIPYEIIIGSNGSTDRTVELGMRLSEQHRKIHFFHLPDKGVGAALKEGVRRARYERIITVDMDLSINLDFVLAANRLLDEYDIIIGSKSTGSQKRSWIRKMASNSFIDLARLLLKIDFHDYSIAAKGYRKEILKGYLPCMDDKTFYVVAIVHRAYREGKRLKEIPVTCLDLRESRFNLIHEGVYKFGNLLCLWLRSSRALPNRNTP